MPAKRKGTPTRCRADPVQAIDLHLRFTSKEAAISFAEKNGAAADPAPTLVLWLRANLFLTVRWGTAQTAGWAYTITEPKRRDVSVKRTYADNFRYKPGKLRLIHTK